MKYKIIAKIFYYLCIILWRLEDSIISDCELNSERDDDLRTGIEENFSFELNSCLETFEWTGHSNAMYYYSKS